MSSLAPPPPPRLRPHAPAPRARTQPHIYERAHVRTGSPGPAKHGRVIGAARARQTAVGPGGFSPAFRGHGSQWMGVQARRGLETQLAATVGSVPLVSSPAWRLTCPSGLDACSSRWIAVRLHVHLCNCLTTASSRPVACHDPDTRTSRARRTGHFCLLPVCLREKHLLPVLDASCL